MSDGKLLAAVVLNMGLTVVEVVAGLLSGSLSLIADAVHNFNDSAALLIALLARRVSRRAPDAQFTFGYRRAELIGAMINLTSLVIIGLFLLYEAGERIINPAPVKGMWVMIASGVALFVDLATAMFLWAMSRGNMNMRAAFIHNLTDAAASVAVLLGGLAIWKGYSTLIDPLLTILIALYTLGISLTMLRKTASILMEQTPPGVDIEQVRAEMMAVSGVTDVHHLHLWQLDEQRNALEAHVVIDDASPALFTSVKCTLRDMLRDRHQIAHSTLELELPGEPCAAHDAHDASPCYAPQAV